MLYEVITKPTATILPTPTETSTPSPTPAPGPLSASFQINQTTGSAPFTVRFTDTSSGSPTWWYWNFGDGTRSTLQNPVKTYTNRITSYNVCYTKLLRELNQQTIMVLQLAEC